MREAEPLTEDELGQFVRAAGEMSARYRLAGHILPFTGLRATEFKHLHRDWIQTLEPIEDNLENVDELQIVVPDESQCKGTLKFGAGTPAPGRTLERRESGCPVCSPADYWRPPFDSWTRRIHVTEEPAVNTIGWWFSRHDSNPCRGTVANIIKEIAYEANIDRAEQLTTQTLRDTFGALLFRSGFDVDRILDTLGYAAMSSLKPLLEFTNRSIDRHMNGRIPDEVLIEELRRLAQATHRPPKLDEMRTRGNYAGNTYIEHFGSWNNALRAAGFEPRYKSKQPLSEEELLDDLRELSDYLGHPPTKQEIIDHGKHSPTTYSRRFGGLEEARLRAGLTS